MTISEERELFRFYAMLYRDIRIKRLNRSNDHISDSLPMKVLQNVREGKTVISPRLLGYTLGVFLAINSHGEITEFGKSVGKNWTKQFLSGTLP